MKKLSIIFSLIMLLTIVTSSYAHEGENHNLAQNITNKTRERVASVTANTTKDARQATNKSRSDSDILSDLKKRADKEITRRLTFLNELLTRVDKIKKLSEADKTDLKSQIQTQINGLTALQTKIGVDTDLTTLKADVNSIVSDYYIYAFFRVKINLLFAADRMSVAADRLTTLAAKFDTRINEAEAAGTDVTQLNVLLTDMNAKIASAKAQYDSAEALLKGLDAKGYPGNKSSLEDARDMIKQGTTDLRAAQKDAISIKQGLGDSSLRKDDSKNRIPETPESNN